MSENILYYGDNLDVMRLHIEDESVDLVYLDPPFNSNQAYNVLFADHDEQRSAAQIKAFDDTWRWDIGTARTFEEFKEAGPERVVTVLESFYNFLSTSDMMAYLVMMAPRLVELHRVLKSTGSLYLHCDPTASHYLKLLMDSVFGPAKFKTEIIWKRSSAHSDTKQGRQQHGRIHDVLLFYSKTDEWKWNPVYVPYDEEYIRKFYRHVEPETGRHYRLSDITGPGGAAKGNPKYEVMGVVRYWRYSREKMEELIRQGRIVQTRPGAVPAYKRYLDEMPGVSLQDIWTDINPLAPQAAERLGYPTQKPLALLKRIIMASSDEDDTVLDPFCGCGTTIDAAQELNRRWIGIDITHLAISLIKHRLRDRYGDQVAYEVIGEPVTVDEAAVLAQEDPYQFQWWALGLVGARPAEQKKGADKGIDGRLRFHDEPTGGKTKHIIFSVKAGKTGVAHVRDLRGVIEREKAQIGVLITMQEPTRPMLNEAAEAGFYDSRWGKHPRIQIRTVEELLSGKGIDVPPIHQLDKTFKRAPRFKDKGEEQRPLLKK